MFRLMFHVSNDWISIDDWIDRVRPKDIPSEIDDKLNTVSCDAIQCRDCGGLWWLIAER